MRSLEAPKGHYKSDIRISIDGATATDVHQGSSGDCWFLAALMAISASDELIKNLCVAKDEKVGVYGFVFYRDGEWIYEVIDDKLYLKVGDDDELDIVRDWNRHKKEGRSIFYDGDKLKEHLQKGGEALYFSHCKSNETWLPLIEKAYAKAHGDYASIEGGYASEGIEDLTGGVGVVLNPEDIMDKERFWRDQLSQVNTKYLFGGGSKSKKTKGIEGGHAYAVLKAWEEGDLKLLKLRNPWGEVEWEGDWSDGSKLWTPDMMTKLGHTFGDDGVFWMSYKDFLKHFPSINRVRLFNKDWHVSQQWTCVKVPWTVDYLDTHFQFTISEKGPVVIVMSQPDERYFSGLTGRFWYSMHFRVYKEGDEQAWLVRSMHNSGSSPLATRSVSAEIEDLDPGTYNVIFKVTGNRYSEQPTPEQMISKYAIERKEKLLYVGRRFDYAQTKGNLRGAEEAVKKQARQEDRLDEKCDLKKARKLKKLEKEQQRKRKERIEVVMKEKRKAVAAAKKEQAKQKKLRMKEQEAAKKAAKEAQKAEAAGKAAKTAATVTVVGEEKNDEANSDVVTPASDSTSSGGEQAVSQNAGDKKSSEEARALSADMASLQMSDRTDTTKSESTTTSEGTSNSETTTASEGTESTEGTTESCSDDEEEYISPIEDPEQLTDNDFNWDSELDAPIDIDSDDEAPASVNDSNDAIFGNDPWNALCVLGLRVYSQKCEAQVKVMQGDDSTQPEPQK
jgi:hypothetical protein